MTEAMTDPFSWLEDDTPESLAWQVAEDERAGADLLAHPAYLVACAALKEAAVGFKAAPVHAGGLWFRLVIGPRGMAVATGPAPDDIGAILCEAADTSEGAVLLQMLPSPQGRFVALVVAPKPSGATVLRIVDVARGSITTDRLPLRAGPLGPSLIAWKADESGLYCMVGEEVGKRWGKRRLVYLALGNPQPVEEPVELEALDVEPQTSSDGKYTLVLTRTASEPYPSWIKHEASGRWRPFFRTFAGRCRGVFNGNHYVAVTTEGASRGRLVAIPLDDPEDRERWIELIPEGEHVMWSISKAGDRLMLSELGNACMNIHILGLDGRKRTTLPSPGPGAVGVIGPARVPGSDVAAFSADHVVFTHQTHVSSPALYKYDVKADILTQIEPPQAIQHELVTRRIFATAADGTEIPIQITHRRDLERSVENPTILTAYGGFGIADLPMYMPNFIPFMKAGGVLAWATIRGGGELGEAWHRSGSGRNKPTSYGDFCSAAEFLIKSDITTRDKLGIFGASNGGLVVAAAATCRPELFKAVVAHIPFADLLHYGRDPISVRWLFDEWGDPRDSSMRDYLKASSPYYAIKSGTAYPALLTIAGSSDDMSPAWHARKLAARMEEAGGSAKVFFRVWEGFGHIEAAAAPPERAAEWMSFLARKLDVDLSIRYEVVSNNVAS